MLSLKLNHISRLFRSQSSQHINYLLHTALHSTTPCWITGTLLLPPSPTHTHTHYQPIVLVVHTYYQLIVLSTVHLRVLQQGNNPGQQQEGRSPCRPERSKGSAPAHPRSSAAPAAEFLHATSNTETQVRRRLMLYFCSSWLVTYSLLTGK